MTADTPIFTADAPTAAELAEIRDSLETICREVAPRDLAGKNLYIVWRSELLDTPADIRVSLGCTTRNLDLIAKPAIGEKWRGRGPALYLNDQSLWGMACGRVDASWPNPAASARLIFAHSICEAITIHELGHVAEDGFERKEVQEPERYAEKLLPLFRNHLETIEPTRLERTERDHGAEWIRCTLHMSHRATSISSFSLLQLELSALTLSTEFYGLSPTGKYFDAIGDEPARMIDASFAEILATEPPAAFTELFTSDRLARKGKSL
jgi:hypothetical protein